MQIQEHIRTYGAAVITRMTLPQGFKEYFNSNRTAIYDNPKAVNDLSKLGSSVNHAVVLAGYNNIESHWIIWSSWGKDWADGGFARVGYGHAVCPSMLAQQSKLSTVLATFKANALQFGLP